MRVRIGDIRAPMGVFEVLYSCIVFASGARQSRRYTAEIASYLAMTGKRLARTGGYLAMTGKRLARTGKCCRGKVMAGIAKNK